MNSSNTDSKPESDDVIRDVDVSHLEAVDDGCGCAEVWEELSDQRHGED
jgi:hypothetical protein